MRILVAMSGGVDSAVTALLLKEAGHTPVGITAKLWQGMPVSDLADAAQVAQSLGIEHYVVDLQQEFQHLVIDAFVEAYDRGYTPNPCIVCNKFIKFDLLWGYLDTYACAGFATGHYARVADRDGHKVLLRAKDFAKDQSYVLAHLTQAKLAKLFLPLGEFSKGEIRQRAEQAGIKVAHKSDSQDICFVPDGDYTKVLERHGLKHSHVGNFELLDGRKIAKHRGAAYYTIGQRKGLGIAWAHPLYVVAKDAGRNAVVLGTNEDLFQSETKAGGLSFINPVPNEFHCTAKIRYRAQDAACKVWVTNNRARVLFDEPQRAITPGQEIVFYQGEEVLGGGTIL